MQTEKHMFESIVTKVYMAGGADALERFITTQGEDCPAIKLTSQEMEFLKGGGLRSWIKRAWENVKVFVSDLIDAIEYYQLNSRLELAAQTAGQPR